MLEVIIAPANMLGQLQSKNRALFNDVGHLPLGPKTAVVTAKFSDDDVSTEITTVNIADSKTRNEQYIEPRLYEQRRSLIGKKSNVTSPNIFDLTFMTKFNETNAAKTTQNEYADETYRRYNFVSMPFTKAEPFIPTV